MTASIPTSVTSTAAGFQPAFKLVTTKDRHACALATIATPASTPLENVWQKAEELGLPKTGPYAHVLDGDFLAKLLAQYSWVATVWKECETPSQLPDLCMVMVDYDPEWEAGRFGLFHRAKGSHDAKFVEYVIDPTVSDDRLVRTDLNVLVPSWYIGVHRMGKAPNLTAKK